MARGDLNVVGPRRHAFLILALLLACVVSPVLSLPVSSSTQKHIPALTTLTILFLMHFLSSCRMGTGECTRGG